MKVTTTMQTMVRQARRTTLAGVLAMAGTMGGFAAGIAWATSGVGITTAIVSGPTVLGEIDVRSESETNELEIKTKGFSNVYTVHNKIAPGGHTGWHSHPGPSIISVKSGTATAYDGDDPNRTPQVFPAGTSFVDDGHHAHIIRNEGSTDLELVAFQVLPVGAPRRIDQPKPAHYNF